MMEAPVFPEEFNYSKSWTSKEDFPTYEEDEDRVRADMQLLFDEVAAYVNTLVESLSGDEGTGASAIGAVDAHGIVTTVQDMLTDVATLAIEAYEKKHAHSNKSALDTMPSGGVVGRLGADDTTVPTSKAVSDAMISAGNLPSGGSVGQALRKRSAANYDVEWGDVQSRVFHAGPTAPADQTLLWVDTTPVTGGLKYYDGGSWAHVPVAYN